MYSVWRCLHGVTDLPLLRSDTGAKSGQRFVRSACVRQCCARHLLNKDVKTVIRRRGNFSLKVGKIQGEEQNQAEYCILLVLCITLYSYYIAQENTFLKGYLCKEFCSKLIHRTDAFSWSTLTWFWYHAAESSSYLAMVRAEYNCIKVSFYPHLKSLCATLPLRDMFVVNCFPPAFGPWLCSSPIARSQPGRVHHRHLLPLLLYLSLHIQQAEFPQD